MRLPGCALLPLSLCLVAACGGKVSVDDEGSAGNGASGNSTTGNGAAGPGAGPGPGSGPGSTGSGSSEDLCDQVCDMLADLGCSDDPACPQACVEYGDTLPSCEPLFLSVLACQVANAADVECGNSLPPQCEDAANALDDCASTCSSASCSGNTGKGCWCESNCGQEVTCEWDPNGGANCQCKAEGTLVGECHDPDTSNACSPQSGCCTVFF
jgi:hypothetical protein